MDHYEKNHHRPDRLDDCTSPTTRGKERPKYSDHKESRSDRKFYSAASPRDRSRDGRSRGSELKSRRRSRSRERKHRDGDRKDDSRKVRRQDEAYSRGRNERSRHDSGCRRSERDDRDDHSRDGASNRKNDLSQSRYESRRDRSYDRSRERCREKSRERSRDRSDRNRQNSSTIIDKNQYPDIRSSVPVQQNISIPQAPSPSAAATNPFIQANHKYLKSSVVNSARFALQEEKKKLLWGDSKAEGKKSSNSWESLQFSGAKGVQMTEKFRKLMGIKNESSKNTSDGKAFQTQETLFKELDKQYEVARISTHSCRGIGLGFASK